MGKVFFFVCFLMSCAVGLQAQTEVLANDSIITPPDPILKTPEVMPEFPGGQSALMLYLSKQPYPPFFRENDVEGTVYVQFVIEQDGSINEVKIARSSGWKEYDNPAIEHVKAMPNWKPGYQDGKPVRVQYVVPIKFKLS